MMKLTLIVLAGTCFVVIQACKNNPGQGLVNAIVKDSLLHYPETRKDTVKDDFFGTSILDPYRWLEDDNSEETKSWVIKQNELTFSYLGGISFRKNLHTRIEKLFNFEKWSTPNKKAGKYYYFKNNGLQNQDILYAADRLTDDATLVIDPNTFSKDGTTSMSEYNFSKDGKYMSFQTSVGGSDWNQIMVMDLKTRVLIKDTIRWVKFSSTEWKGDGFYYSRYPEPKGNGLLSAKNEYHSLYFHKLGNDQSKDQLIYRDLKNPLRNVECKISEDERFLIVSGSESTSGNSFAVQDLSKRNSELNWLVRDFKNDYRYIGNLNDTLFFHTNQGSSNWNVFAVDMKRPDKKFWRIIIPEEKDVLQNVSLIGGKLVANYLHNASSVVKIFNLEGHLMHTLELPELGTVGAFSGNQKEGEAFYSFSSFIRPVSIYRIDLDNYKTDVFFTPKLADYNPDLYITEQVWYSGKDGVKIPMFITHKKDFIKGKKPATLLYAYGGFDISIVPSFSSARIPIIENDGIYAVANIRGGGEFGKEWHLSGTKERKQNVFDDFIAAADYLVNENYTDRDHLAIQGGSNGGLLVGATITQKPDLCKVAFPAVGVLDMLRYHKFTIGWAWATDYGTSETKEGFDYLIRYSPLHNAKRASYPATLITTADHDDRVVPAHSFKFAAAMQDAAQGTNPMLIRVDVSAGHGAGKPTSKRIDEAADVLSFMFFQMGIHPKI